MPSAAPLSGAGRASTSSVSSGPTPPAAATSSSTQSNLDRVNGVVVNGDDTSGSATTTTTTTTTTMTTGPGLPNDATAASATPTANRPHAAPSITSSTSSSKPSLLSRLGMPSLSFRSRNRNVVDFHVRADEPYKKYAPGDTVRGSVLLAISKPIRLTHLVVALHGYVHVYRDASAAAKARSTSIQPRSGISELPQYHGNGLASLFQDEQVLSGEGRLEAGRYEFGFELIFPDIGLPSSIEFERGTISYMITATLTRPTAIAPTTSCDTRILLSDNIDISHIPPPRPRTIFLEPISKRVRRKRSTGLDKATIDSQETATPSTLNSNSAPTFTNDLTSEPETVERTVTTSESARDHQTESRPGTHIDARSEISGESGRSGRSGRSVSTAMSRSDFAMSQASSAYKSPAKQKVVDNKTITATIDVLKGGCLAGDTISVRVSVQHIKRLKSMTGVIVTLYRQGKMDSAPPATLFTGNDIEDGNEPHTRSRLGLGGLSLSSTGSASMFRKDLDQNTAPLIVDPNTLRASVTLSLRLPDDAFPTIRGVPGGMISFRYHVEVIVDLGGKLSNQVLQGGQTSNSRVAQPGMSDSEPVSNSYAPKMTSNIIDTSPLRRQKGVVSVSMEVIVGTTDSARGKRALRIRPPQNTTRVTESDEDDAIRPDQDERTPVAASAPSPRMYLSPPSTERLYTSPPQHPPHHPPSPGPSQPGHAQPNGYTHEAAPAYIPRPQLPDHNALSEKERIRQAETRLLPSQPSASGEGSSSAPDEDDIYEAQDTPRPPFASPSSPETVEDADVAGPSAPTEADLASSSQAPTSEDKQELERRRLIDEASAPPEFPEDMEHSSEPSAPTNGEASSEAEPSAPVLDEEDEDLSAYGVGAGPSSGSRVREAREQLPAYER